MEKSIGRKNFNLPKLAIVSVDIRRDLHDPLKYFTKFRVHHFYRKSTYVDFDLPSQGVGRFRNPLNLWRQLRKFEPDVVQGSEPYAFPQTAMECLIPLLYSKFYGKVFYFPMLENRPPDKKFGKTRLGPLLGRILPSLLKSFLRIYASQAETIFALNEGAVRNLRAVGVDKKKIRRNLYGTWGINMKEFSPPEDFQNRGDKNVKIILFVGRLEPFKGEEVLLEAFKYVKQNFKNAILLIIGEGKLKLSLEESIKEAGLKGIVQLKGRVKNEELTAYFRAATITVTPSYTVDFWEEQVGMVNIQSMACGTPVVSTFSGAIPEYVVHGETGLLVREKDSRELSRAILTLLQDEELRKRMGKKGRELCLLRYNAEENVKRTEEIVYEIYKNFSP